MRVQWPNIGQNGLNSDLQAQKTEPGQIMFGKNFRVINSSVESLLSSYSLISETIANAGAIFPVKTPTETFTIVMGRSAVHVYNGLSSYNITPVAGLSGIGVNDEFRWGGCMLGQIPVINNPLNYPYYWSPQSVSQVLQPLKFDAGNTWAQKNFHAKVFRSHNTFLFALNLQEGGVDKPDSFRWSHPADVNGLPFTWDETDLSAIAGIASLGGDGGYIVDGLSLRENFIIYSQNAINVLSPSGDDQIWTRRKLSDIGSVSKDSQVEVDGKHFFISKGDILVTDGLSVQSIAHNKIKSRLSSLANFERYETAFTVKNIAKNEVWFCVPEDNSLLPSTAYIYNWKDDAWGIKDIEETTAHGIYGAKTTPPVTWETVTGTWEDSPLTWSSQAYSDDGIIFVEPLTGRLFSVDDQLSQNYSYTVIEGSNIALSDETTTITRIYPLIKGQVDLKISIGSQDHLNAPVRWSDEITFNPALQKKIDIRTTGKYHAYRIRSDAKLKWQLTGMDVEYQEAGKR